MFSPSWGPTSFRSSFGRGADSPRWSVFEGGIRAGRAGGRRVLVVAMLVILGWGALVNASGALLRSSYCWSATPVHVDLKPSRIWNWSDPQFLRPVNDAFDGASLHDVVLESCSAA